jgi:hypothetical protein
LVRGGTNGICIGGQNGTGTEAQSIRENRLLALSFLSDALFDLSKWYAFGNDVMQLSYRHASICANFSFSFLKKVVRDQRWPTAPLFAVNTSPPFAQFTAPLSHILPIHNVTTNSNNLFVNFRWTFTFCVEKSYGQDLHVLYGTQMFITMCTRACH